MTRPRSLGTERQGPKADGLTVPLDLRVGWMRLRLPDHSTPHPPPPVAQGTKQQGGRGWRGWEALEPQPPANPAQLGD